jgi:hypothetical protein
MKQYRVHIGTDPNGNEIYRIEDIPDNKAIPIEEAAKIHKNNAVPKEKSTAELIAEAQKVIDYNKEIERLYNKEFPAEQQPKPKINEIKRLSKLLQDYRYNN